MPEVTDEIPEELELNDEEFSELCFLIQKNQNSVRRKVWATWGMHAGMSITVACAIGAAIAARGNPQLLRVLIPTYFASLLSTWACFTMSTVKPYIYDQRQSIRRGIAQIEKDLLANSSPDRDSLAAEIGVDC